MPERNNRAGPVQGRSFGRPVRVGSYPASRLLVARLGGQFIAALPSGPGAYLMSGENEGVLFVGKARNLHKRLSSFLEQWF